MYPFLSIEDFHLCLNNDKTSCLNAVQFYLHQIKLNVHLNTFLEVFESESIARAIELDEKRKNGIKLGKLYGVVVSIKDVLCYKDHICSASSKILENFVSLYSATAVQKLLDEDAIIIGRLNCDEFAMGSSNENSAFGPVLNPIDNTKVPGGSSGGSAVAIAANLSMISLGSDTGGSVRQPADYCGVIGFKPSYGRISRYGLIAYGSSFDCIGIFAKQIKDIALTLEVIAGCDNYDSTCSHLAVKNYSSALSNSTSLKIGYFAETLTHPALDPEIKSTIESFLNKLNINGHTVKPINFSMLDYIVPAYYILATAEASSNLSRYDGVHYGYRTKESSIKNIDDMIKQTRHEGFGKEVQKRILLGTFVLSAEYYDSYYNKAQKIRNKLALETKEIFSQFDCIISPTSPSTAFELNKKNKSAAETYITDLYTVYANLVGIPAISIPLFKHTNQLPFGLQIMTDNFKEDKLLSIANQLLNMKN